MDLVRPAFLQRPVRVLVYAFGWMLTIGLITFVMSRMDPLCHFLYDQHELPRLTRIFWGFARLNSVGFSSPAILLLLAFLMLDEVVVRALGDQSLSGRLWFAFWLGVGVLLNLLFLLAVSLL